VTAYTSPPAGATTICVDELGPVIPRTFPPAPGWSPTGTRIHAPLEYSRGPEKVWVYGALRVCDGQALTLTTRSRNTAGYLQLLEAIAAANPTGDLYLISDNRSSHKRPPIQEWLAKNPRGAARLHPRRGLLAQPPGALVAHVPACGVRRADICRRWGDRSRHGGGHGAAQCPRATVDLGPSPAPAARPAPCLRLPHLRNGALVRHSLNTVDIGMAQDTRRWRGVPPDPGLRAGV